MVTPRFCSAGYILMQISAMDELDGVWHKSLNSYRDNVIRDATDKNPRLCPCDFLSLTK